MAELLAERPTCRRHAGVPLARPALVHCDVHGARRDLRFGGEGQYDWPVLEPDGRAPFHDLLLHSCPVSGFLSLGRLLAHHALPNSQRLVSGWSVGAPTGTG